MDRLRDLRGADTRERDLANILGFEHSRAVRWKEGQMYVDRAEYLLRLADSIEVDPMLLVGLAAGSLSLAEAQRQLGRAGKVGEEAGKKRARAAEPAEAAGSARGTVLLVSTESEGRADLEEVVTAGHPDISCLTSGSLAAGISLAERHRPELALLDMGLASVHAFDAIRLLASLSTRAQHRCRVVAGTSTMTDAIEKPALMAGASGVALFPFARHVFEIELDRLEERLGPRKPSKK